MSEEKMNVTDEKKRRALFELRTSGEVYVLISECTRMPYVACDAETFDDEVFVFMKEEDARREAAGLVEEGNPLKIAKVENKSLLSFYISLCPMGVNSIVVNKGTNEEIMIQIAELIQRPDEEKLPEGQVRVENTAFHLTALYFAQAFRRQQQRERSDELMELNEEMMAHFGKGRYIVAVSEDQQLPILRHQNGQVYQPLFTDVQEFNKFNREQNFKAAVVESAKLTGFLSPEAVGVVINPFGVNIKLDIARPKQA